MSRKFKRTIVCLFCGALALQACNRKVATRDEAGENSPPVTEEMETRDEAALERSISGGAPAEETTAATPPDAAGDPVAGPPVDPLSPYGMGEAAMSDREMLGVEPAQPAANVPSAPEDFRQYEAWFTRNGLDLNQPGMLDDDPDGDGYSNRDEFLADTNPNDSASHPGFHAQMRLREVRIVEEPLILENVNGGKATVRNTATGKTATVTMGDTVPGTSMKVAKVRKRVQTDKFGMEDDVSQVTVVDGNSGEETTFVTGLSSRSGSTSAVLTSMTDPSQTVTVRQGQTFEFPSEPGKSYTVIDMRETQIVVRDVDTGETWTIPKL